VLIITLLTHTQPSQDYKLLIQNFFVNRGI